MSLHLYNTFTKHEEEFVPRKKGHVTMYTCGPTVYGRPHIGNYSSFLMADLLRRWLETGHQYTVTHVKNITDVGHLVADLDDGEDKVQKEAEKEKMDPLSVAKRYTDMYLEDEKALNMREPEHRPRASAYVEQMIEMTKKLVEKGNAYETEDGVYFAVETFPAYGNLSGNTLEKLDAGARISVDEAKRHPADFALWKKCVGKNAHHILRWPSPWGEGFPGWHIECSAMSAELLGEKIDIHTGGEDNIFPHHECEIAQSGCAFGLSPSEPFAKIWLHKRRIEISNKETLRSVRQAQDKQAQGDSPEASQKMSKSLGNVLGLPDIVAKGYSPMDLRYLLLSVHYRTNLKFSFENLDTARKTRLKIVEWMANVASTVSKTGVASHGIENITQEFSSAMDSDLNTSAAVAVIFFAMNFFYKQKSVSEQDLARYHEFASLVSNTFGCFDAEQESVPDAVQILLHERANARAKKDFAASDRLRDEMKSLGYEVRDSGKEQTVKKL